jgi:hypothetical protein
MSASSASALVDQSVMEDHRNQTKLILERIRSAPSLRLCQSFEDMEEIAEDLPLPKQLAYWSEMHEDARLAEQILGFDEASKISWNQHISQLRKRAYDALREAGKMSVMLWEQVSEAEEFELNPERYWKTIITDALNLVEAKRKVAEMRVPGGEAQRGLYTSLCVSALAAGPPPPSALPMPPGSWLPVEDDAPPPLPEPAVPDVPLAAGAAAAASGEARGVRSAPVYQHFKEQLQNLAKAKKETGWASSACSMLEMVLDNIQMVREDEVLCGLAKELCQRAVGDCEFAHCYLSVAEDAECALS